MVFGRKDVAGAGKQFEFEHVHLSDDSPLLDPPNHWKQTLLAAFPAENQEMIGEMVDMHGMQTALMIARELRIPVNLEGKVVQVGFMTFAFESNNFFTVSSIR